MISWWGRHFILAESVVSLAAVSLFVYWSEQMGGWATVDSELDTHRAALYGTTASLAGSLLGFVIAAFAIAIAPLGSVRLRPLRSSGQVETLIRVFTAATVALGLTTVLSLVSLVVDDDKEPVRWLFYATAFGSLLSLVGLARSVWALHNVVTIVTGPSRARGGDE